jgi:formyltetrahydrofolate synthetase
MEEKLSDLKLKTATHELKIEEIVRRIESYHHDHKQEVKYIKTLLEGLPNEDKIFRMFSEEGRKLAEGLIKRDDKQEIDIDNLKDKYTEVDKRISNNSMGWKIGTGIMASYFIVKDWLLK